MALSVGSKGQFQVVDGPIFNFTLARMAIINKQQGLARLWRNRNPSTLFMGMQTGTATVENSMEFPHKTKDGTAF